MPIYDILGNKIINDMTQVTVNRNNETYVSEFLAVAQSYLNKSDLVYRDGNTIFYVNGASDGIDCSTYVGLCLMGYPYTKSPYYTHQSKELDEWEANMTDYDWPISTIRYTASRFIDGHDPNERLRLASQFARWMTNRGQSVPLANGFRDVMPGDIVFWGRKRKATDDWMHPDWYLHINHIGIILTRETPPNTYEYIDGNGNTRTASWDKLKYPFKHQIIEVGVATPPCMTTHWLEEGQEDATNVYANNANTVVAICRPDLGALQADNA